MKAVDVNSDGNSFEMEMQMKAVDINSDENSFEM